MHFFPLNNLFTCMCCVFLSSEQTLHILPITILNFDRLLLDSHVLLERKVSDFALLISYPFG
uniref:Uncharacterized protein n=1 Tax=Arundo donax TaxID=35708 RepID=A0A0A8XNM4_ARUDO